jgi:hypothetical protein
MNSTLNSREHLEFQMIYRGTVVDNYDPEIKGRCKLYVPGVYPEVFRNDPSSLPWAEPVMPLYGGNFHNSLSGSLNMETGVTTIPHVGAELWTFFENYNHMYPKFFGACQGGSGWMSEHDNQHVIKTDNVRIRIDEKPALSGSTCKFDSYNAEVGEKIPFSKTRSFQNRPTRVDVQIKAKGNVALNVQIEGDVNMNIVGNVMERIVGDRHETHIGNYYRYHKGDTWIAEEGAMIIEKSGDTDIHNAGNLILKIIGSLSLTITDMITNIFFGPRKTTIYNHDNDDIKMSKTMSAGMGLTLKSATGIDQTAVGNITQQCAEYSLQADNDINVKSLAGNIMNSCPSRGYYTDKLDGYKYRFRGGIINEADYIANITQGSIVNAATTSGMVYGQIVADVEKVADLYDAVHEEIRYPVFNEKMILFPLDPRKWDWQYKAWTPVYDELGMVIGFVNDPQVVLSAPTIDNSTDGSIP